MDDGAADLGMVRVPFDAFVDLRLRLPRLSPPPPLDGSRAGWPEAARLPDLSGLHGQAAFAQVWGGWSVEGLAFAFEVRAAGGLRLSPDRPFHSDGVEIWCDTRDSRVARKLTRFCHHFIVLPAGGGPGGSLPAVLEWNPGGARKPDGGTDPGRIRAAAQIRAGQGYTLEVFLPRAALTGYAPLESAAVGLGYRVRSSTLGTQDLAFGERFPIWRNPSLWRSARLEGAEGPRRAEGPASAEGSSRAGRPGRAKGPGRAEGPATAADSGF